MEIIYIWSSNYKNIRSQGVLLSNKYTVTKDKKKDIFQIEDAKEITSEYFFPIENITIFIGENGVGKSNLIRTIIEQLLYAPSWSGDEVIILKYKDTIYRVGNPDGVFYKGRKISHPPKSAFEKIKVLFWSSHQNPFELEFSKKSDRFYNAVSDNHDIPNRTLEILQFLMKNKKFSKEIFNFNKIVEVKRNASMMRRVVKVFDAISRRTMDKKIKDILIALEFIDLNRVFSSNLFVLLWIVENDLSVLSRKFLKELDVNLNGEDLDEWMRLKMFERESEFHDRFSSFFKLFEIQLEEVVRTEPRFASDYARLKPWIEKIESTNKYIKSNSYQLHIGNLNQSKELLLLIEVNNKFGLYDINLGGVSSGQYSKIAMYYSFYSWLEKKNIEGVELIFLDEPEAFLHPEWQRIFFYELKYFMQEFYPKRRSLKFIVATHSPVLVTDIPSSNVYFYSNSEKSFVINTHRTFGSNIYELYRTGFCLESVKGKMYEHFVSEIMKGVSGVSLENLKKYYKLFSLIGERFERDSAAGVILRELEEKLKDSREYKMLMENQKSILSKIEEIREI